MKGPLEITKEETTVAYFKTLCRHLFGGFDEIREKE
jgi:hypothetical protein